MQINNRNWWLCIISINLIDWFLVLIQLIILLVIIFSKEH